jgi:hypothetical protein
MPHRLDVEERAAIRRVELGGDDRAARRVEVDAVDPERLHVVEKP